jgi:hypothetical protein
MQTIIDIIGRAGGWRPDLYLQIENPPCIPLVIELLTRAARWDFPQFLWRITRRRLAV